MYTAIVRGARRCVVDCPPASVGTAVADCCYLCWLLPNRVHGLVQDEVARCNEFEIHSAWSVCTAVRTVLCKDARQMRAAVDSGCNESAQLMCGLSNHGVCRLPWKFTALWRCLGDGRALSTHAPLALERRTIHSDLSSGRGDLRVLQRAGHPNVFGCAADRTEGA